MSNADSGQTFSDLRALEALREDEIDLSDSPELGDSFFEHATYRPPTDPFLAAIWAEPGVAEWFYSRGEAGFREAAEALREYVERKKGAA